MEGLLSDSSPVPVVEIRPGPKGPTSRVALVLHKPTLENGEHEVLTNDSHILDYNIPKKGFPTALVQGLS